MTQNRKQRRAALAATKSLVRLLRPQARFIEWSALDRRNPKLANKFTLVAALAGFSRAEIVLYEHDGCISMMYPPEYRR